MDIELVVKIGSMALIRREDNDIDYNLFSRLGGELRPGMALVSSGAPEDEEEPFRAPNPARPTRKAMAPRIPIASSARITVAKLRPFFELFAIILPLFLMYCFCPMISPSPDQYGFM